MSKSHLEYWEYLSFMVKVNISQLLTVEGLQFVINDKILHLQFSFIHWDSNSGSGH